MAQQAGVVVLADGDGSMDEVRGTNGGGCALVAEVLAKAGGRILKCEVAGGSFGVKRGNRSVGAAVVMLKGIQQIERIFWCLPAGEGAQLHHQERPDLTNADREALFRAEKICAPDYLRAGGRERTINSREDVGGDIVHHDDTLCSRWPFNEEIQVDGVGSDDALETGLEFLAGAEPLGLKIARRLPYWPDEAPRAMPMSTSTVAGLGSRVSDSGWRQMKWGTSPPTSTRSSEKCWMPAQTVSNAGTESAIPFGS